METLHDVKRLLKTAKEDYNAQRANLDAQARDKALKEMLQKQRTLERMQFIRSIIDFDLPDNAVVLIPVDNYFRDKWRMEDKELAGTPVQQYERSSIQSRHKDALDALKRCHNAFYDAVDKVHAETAAKERALGFESASPPLSKERYVIPKREVVVQQQVDPVKPGGFTDMCCAFFALCFLCGVGYGLYWCGKQLLTLF